MKSRKNIRTDHETRLKAFNLILVMKDKNLLRQQIVNKIHDKFNIPLCTLYEWYREKRLPHGRKGEIFYKPELFYVLGALLGDGCLYNWRVTNHYVILVGDIEFTTKYAKFLNLCTNIKAKPYIDRSKNIYFVRINNFELYNLFKKSRKNINYLKDLLKDNGRQSFLFFIEGFFDAEGCVKIIKGKGRHTPKICLDTTNTNLKFLNLLKQTLNKQLNIRAKYSIQKPLTENRKTTYHLRIYKKKDIKRFFKYIKTTKLKKEKIIYVQKWLNLEDNFSLPLSN